jgi:hypothetical protein
MLTKEALKHGKKILSENGIDEREARLLLAHAINVAPSDLIRYDTCTDGDFYRYTECLNRRIAGEPFAYIVGEKEFMKLKFMVNKNVLVPREDTEILVLEAIKQCRKKILDLCTGSGCIAISLSKYIQNAEIDASDFYIYEPNYDVHIDENIIGPVDTFAVDGGTYENTSYMIYQTASDWKEAYPVQKDVTVKTLGEFVGDTYLFTLEADDMVRADLYIWLEGQDVDCVNSAAASSFAVNIALAGGSE